MESLFTYLFSIPGVEKLWNLAPGRIVVIPAPTKVVTENGNEIAIVTMSRDPRRTGIPGPAVITIQD